MTTLLAERMGTSVAAHLLRRAGFGGTRAEVERLAAWPYAEAVDELCDLSAPDPAADAVPPPSFTSPPGREATAEERRVARERQRTEGRELVLWWLRRMVAAERPMKEKLAFVWHGHFATSLEKVEVPALMHRHQRTLAELGAGRFDALVGAVARDPAMLVWLDGRDNVAGAPNENFARELFELFTLGHGGHGGQPYTEADIGEAARALTGWRIDPRTVAGVFDARRHDDGVKTVLGRTGRLGVDDIIAVATAHPACAPFVASRLWSRLARPAPPDDPVVRALAEPFAGGLDVSALVRRIFLHPEFLAPATRTGLLKSPVEFMVGAARALGLDVEPWWLRALAGLGQVPFVPPDVAGWPENEGWLSTSSARVRLEVATRFASAADLSWLEAEEPSARVGALAARLGVDTWGSATAGALASASGDPRRLVTLALAAPEYLLA